ncbi:hypothetical protein HUO13_20650 [Saccharopolyspora erythraea]|uniref:hypothetical protein n=1 Tax=Saccharopolyspora erythraea TaxID=1836 RepID=UPI001BAA0955|nr:hypothetical protein [Saccharopolyspora erythraea]QUH02901.1 hypothetical protein HUO13_20650 [Saccharopolyspora erythraea]
MAARHVVYRCELDRRPRWSGYAPGCEDLSVRADTLGRAQQLMASAIPCSHRCEHTEHSTWEGLWVREALDDRALEREHTTRVLLEALADARLRARLAALPACPAGGVPVVVGVPGDSVDWIVSQHGGCGALVVAAALTNHRLWWNALLPADRAAGTGLRVRGDLAGLGLDTAEATLDDWMAASDCGNATLLLEQPAVTTPAAMTGPGRPVAEPAQRHHAGR